jgi:putative ABC transport system permease protein
MGMEQSMIDSLIKTQTGHFQIHEKGYYEKSRLLPLDIAMKNPERLIDELRPVQGISGITPRLRFGALANSGTNSYGIMGMGIDPRNEDKVNTIMDKIYQGTRLDDKTGYAIIGKKLADDLNLQIGSMLVIVSNTLYGAMNAAELEIKGIIKSGYPQYDGSIVFMNLLDAQKLLDMENMATDIVINIDETRNTDAILPILSSKLVNYNIEIQTWKDMGESLWRTRRMWNIFAYIINVVVILVAVMGIVNTMLMSVTERTREIGTIMAIGTTQSEILSLFLMEGLVLGIIGGLVGTLLGGVIIQYFSVYGISLEGTSASGIQAMVGDAIHARLSWPDLFISFLMAQIVAVFSAAYPAYIASRHEPAEALRHL